MFGNAFSIAALLSASMFFLFKKLPPKVQEFLIKHAFLTDCICMAFTYVTFGGTVTALAAGIFVDIFVSMMLYVAKHPNDFVWLDNILSQVKTMINKFKQYLLEMNANMNAVDMGVVTP